MDFRGVVLAVLASVPLDVSAAEPLKVASPGFTLVNVDANTGALYADYFNRQLELRGEIHVTSPTELQAILGLERQRALLGCQETGCIAELAGALGAADVITGELGRAGAGWIVNIKVVRANDASTVAVYSSRLADDNALLEFLARSADDLAHRLGRTTQARAETALPTPIVTTATTEAPDRTWVVTGSAGVALLAAGGVGYGLAAGQRSALAQGTQSYATALDVANARFSGERLEATSFALGASGIAALGLAATQLWLPSSSAVRRYAPWAVAGALLVCGIALEASAYSQLGQLQQGNYASLSAFEQGRSSGEQDQAAGMTLMATGVLGLANAALLTFWPRGGPSVAAAGSPHSLGLTLSLEMP